MTPWLRLKKKNLQVRNRLNSFACFRQPKRKKKRSKLSTTAKKETSMTHGSKLLHHFWDELRHSNGITALNTSQKMELKKMIKFCSGWQMMSLKRASFLHHVLANALETLNPFKKKIFSKIFTFCKFFFFVSTPIKNYHPLSGNFEF